MKPEMLHASAVSCMGRGVLFMGPSGSGKSSISLEMMAMGGQLISDDRCIVTRAKGQVLVSAPTSIQGLIEARGVGLLLAKNVGPVVLSLVVDMSKIESSRLPPDRSTQVLAQSLPLLYKVESRYFPAAILQYLEGGAVPVR